jgi:hypothetical protein
VLVNLASYDLHMGKLDAPEQAYLDALEFYSDENNVRDRHNYAVITGNLAFLKAVTEEWDAASAYALDAWRRAAVDGFEPLRATTAVLLGFTKVVLGSTEGVKLVVDGLAESYRNRSTRFVEIGIDYAAGALACLGDGAAALAALDAIMPLREKRRHSRSIAEERIAAWIREKAGTSNASLPWPEPESLLDIVLRVCAALESHLQRS